MASLAFQTRTPVRAAEPVTLVGKLKARQREYGELDTLLMEMIKNSQMPSKHFTAKIDAADRRVSWAYRRLNEIEQRIAASPKDSARRERLCQKAYGCAGIPVGMGNVYESGALAYIEDYAPLDGIDDYESRYTLVPCKVIKISGEYVSVEVTATRFGYTKGEKITTSVHDAIPRDRVEKPKSPAYVINAGWLWAQD